MQFIKDTLFWSLIILWIALGFAIATPIVAAVRITADIIYRLIYLPINRLITWYFFSYRVNKALKLG